MRKLPVIIAAACALSALPALAAENQSYGERQGQSYGERQGQGMRGGTYGEAETHRHGWRAMQEGCKYITVRQRQGDEVIVRHFKRCD